MLILTWNIQWGLGVDERCDLERIARDAQRLADADVLCFREVSDGFPELKGNDGRDQFACLAALFPWHEAILGVNLDVRAPDGRRNRFGNLILSRYPVEQVMRHTLPLGARLRTRNACREGCSRLFCERLSAPCA